MTRRIISLSLVVLGLVVAALAVASATVWRPTDTATLRLPARPETPLVLTEAGVLETVADTVTVTATAADDEEVTLVVGRSADVTAWVGSDPYTSVTGLSSWDELEVAAVDGAAETAAGQTPAPTETPAEPAGSAEAYAALATSDLWVVSETGTGTVRIDWEHRPGRWSVLAATGGAAAPELALTWPVEISTPWLVPGVIAAAVLLLAGLALAALELLETRELRRRRAVATSRAAETAVLPLPATGPAGSAGAAGLTRRELRERARAEEVAAARGARRSRAGATGEVPVQPAPGPAAADGAAAVEATSDTTSAGATSREVRSAGRARGAAVVPGSWRAAGAARGAGVVPASPHAAELRGRSTRPTGPAGPARGAGIVPASSRADRPAPPETAAPPQTGRSAPPGAQATSTWRSLWGFSGTAAQEPARDAPSRPENEEER